MNEIIGEVYMNPMVNVYAIINKNIDNDTVNITNINELIEICIAQAPHRREHILNIIKERLPIYSSIIDKQLILI